MPGATFSAEVTKRKRIEIGAVIDFCIDKGLNISKCQVFDFFEIPQPTGSRWFPSSYSPNNRGKTPSETTLSSASSISRKLSPAVKRQNPVRNGGRDRKKLKSMIECLTEDVDSDQLTSPPSTPALSRMSSSPLPEGPLTPSKSKISQVEGRMGLRISRQGKREAEVEIKSENWDEEIEI